MVKSPRFPASRANHDWLYPRDAGPGIPSQLAAVTDVTGQLLPCTGLEPGRPLRSTERGVAGSFQGDTAADGPPGWATVTHLPHGWWEGYFWKISALSGPASSASHPPPPLINILISPQLLLFLEMRFLFLLQGHDPKDPKPPTNLTPSVMPRFLSNPPPPSLPVTSCRLSRWSVEYKGKCC